MKTRKRSILSILAMILVLAVSASCLFGCGKDDDDDDDDRKEKKSSGYERVLDDFFEAYKKGDGKSMAELAPEKFVKKMFDSREEFADYLDETVESEIYNLEDYDGNIKKMTYKITDDTKLDKDEIKDLKKEWKYRGISMDIKAARELEVDVTIPVDGEKETESFDFTLVEIKGKWYILENDMNLRKFCG